MELPERALPVYRAGRTAKHHRGLVRKRVAVAYDQAEARRIAERSIRKKAAAKNRPTAGGRVGAAPGAHAGHRRSPAWPPSTGHAASATSCGPLDWSPEVAHYFRDFARPGEDLRREHPRSTASSAESDPARRPCGARAVPGMSGGPPEVPPRYRYAQRESGGSDLPVDGHIAHPVAVARAILDLARVDLANLREAMRATMQRSRRSFITAISGTALVALAGTWRNASAQFDALELAREGRAIGEELVDFLETSSAHLSGLPTEQRQHTAPLLDAHLTTVTEFLSHGRHAPHIRLRLNTLAANLSQTVAWHRFDLGLHAEAGKYWIAGLHSAHANGDRDMGAALLGDLAYQAGWLADPRAASGILEQALSRTEHPAAQSLLQLRLARALAAQGEHRATRRALAAAEHLLGNTSGDPVPAWCAWISEADLAVDSGQCLLDLGDTHRAHQLIREGQDLLPPQPRQDPQRLPQLPGQEPPRPRRTRTRRLSRPPVPPARPTHRRSPLRPARTGPRPPV